VQRALLYQVGDPGPEGFETMREELRLAESLGLDAVWCFPNAGEAGDFGEGAPAIWLAALAPSTERIRLGWGLPGLLPPMRPPIREAEQAASLDIAASGRLELALLPVGALEGTDERPWDEGLRMLVAMWEAPVFSWASERFRVAPVSVVPRPEQRPHPPLHLAGWTPDHARRAGQGGLAYVDLSGADDETLEVHLAAYTEGRSEADPEDLVAASGFAAACELEPGPAAEARLRAWETMGVDQAILRAGPLDGGHDEARERIRFLAGVVLD